MYTYRNDIWKQFDSVSKHLHLCFYFSAAVHFVPLVTQIRVSPIFDYKTGNSTIRLPIKQIAYGKRDCAWLNVEMLYEDCRQTAHWTSYTANPHVDLSIISSWMTRPMS